MSDRLVTTNEPAASAATAECRLTGSAPRMFDCRYESWTNPTAERGTDGMARVVTARGLEGHPHHAAHVDAGRRQDTSRAFPLAQSLLGLDAVRDDTGPHHFAHPGAGPIVRDRFRFLGP